jgi:hypothetical protein
MIEWNEQQEADLERRLELVVMNAGTRMFSGTSSGFQALPREMRTKVAMSDSRVCEHDP